MPIFNCNGHDRQESITVWNGVLCNDCVNGQWQQIIWWLWERIPRFNCNGHNRQ